MSEKGLLLDIESRIATITINRPKALNALNRALLIELLDTLHTLRHDTGVRAMIITGAGDKAFVAGADISEMEGMTALEARAFAELGQRVTRMIERIEKPAIAAVNGFCLGGGLELAMCCDIILASEKALFGQPEVKLGVMPGFGGTQRLPKLIGRNNALEMILTGEPIKADEALRLGLVNRVCPPEKLLPEAKALAGKILAAGPAAVGLAKTAVHNGMHLDIDTGLSLEKSLFTACFATNDRKEGMKAFLEKRSPEFKGD